MPAPAAASRKPTYSSGLGATFGGCSQIETSTFTSGAPPNTSGITINGSSDRLTNVPFTNANAQFTRLGTLIKFIPYPVTTGFTTGIAVIIDRKSVV